MDTLIAPSFTTRRPALRGYLARKLLSVKWIETPAPWSHRWVAERCKAELEWCQADWRRMVRIGAAPDRDEYATWGAHPSDQYRLSHETAAARTLNALTHARAQSAYVSRLGKTLRRQREAGPEFALMAADAQADLKAQIMLRRRAWRVYLAALGEYRMARDALVPALMAAE